jgi:hypothetical protein
MSWVILHSPSNPDPASGWVIADPDLGEVWMVVSGPLILEAMAEGHGHWWSPPGMEAVVCMAPASWLQKVFEEDGGEGGPELVVVRETALSMAREAVGAGAKLQ